MKAQMLLESRRVWRLSAFLREPPVIVNGPYDYEPRREAANRCWISSGDRSSLWVAIV